MHLFISITIAFPRHKSIISRIVTSIHYLAGTGQLPNSNHTTLKYSQMAVIGNQYYCESLRSAVIGYLPARKSCCRDGTGAHLNSFPCFYAVIHFRIAIVIIQLSFHFNNTLISLDNLATVNRLMHITSKYIINTQK